MSILFLLFMCANCASGFMLLPSSKFTTQRFTSEGYWSVGELSAVLNVFRWSYASWETLFNADINTYVPSNRIVRNRSKWRNEVQDCVENLLLLKDTCSHPDSLQPYPVESCRKTHICAKTFEHNEFALIFCMKNVREICLANCEQRFCRHV